MTAFSVNDEQIRNKIRQIHEQYNYIICPHTATAFHIRDQLDNEPWIVVATADPCKFDELIEPIVNIKIPVSPQLQKLLDRPNRILRVEASLEAIRKEICR